MVCGGRLFKTLVAPGRCETSSLLPKVGGWVSSNPSSRFSQPPRLEVSLAPPSSSGAFESQRHFPQGPRSVRAAS